MKTIFSLLLMLLLGQPCVVAKTDTSAQSGVTCVAFSPDGKILASGQWDNTVKLWDPDSGKELFTLSGHNAGIGAVAFSPNGEILASGDTQGTIKLWDVTSHKELRSLFTRDWVNSVAFSRDGKILANGKMLATDRAANSIDLWDVASGNKLKTLTGHSAQVSCVAFNPKIDMLASASEDQTVRLWKLPESANPRVLKALSCILSIAFSPDGKTIAASTCVKAVKIWDVFTGKELPAFAVSSAKTTAIAFSPDGRLLAIGDDEKHLDLWDVISRKRTRSLEGHSNWIDSISFRSGGKELASSSRDETIEIWNLDSGAVLRTIVTERSAGVHHEPGILEKIQNGIEFGYKPFFSGVVLFILAVIGAILLSTTVAWLTEGTTKERKAVILSAALLPFVCFFWSVVIFEFRAVVNKCLLDRDGSGGEVYQCPLPDGYGIFMCDITEFGFLYNRKKHSEATVSRSTWQEPSGHSMTESDGVGDVSKLQLAKQYIFGGYVNTERHFQTNEAIKFFLLNTNTDVQTEFGSYQELQRAAENMGVQLKLQPIYDVYRQYRFTWFDNLALLLLFIPPLLAFGFLVNWIVRLRKFRQPLQKT